MILKTMNLPALDRTAVSFAAVKKGLGEPLVVGDRQAAAARSIVDRHAVADATMALALRHNEANRVVDRLIGGSVR